MSGRSVPLALAVLLIATLVGEQPALAEQPRRLSAPGVASVHGTPVKTLPRPADLSQGAATARRDAVAWPAPATGEANLAAVPRTLDQLRGGSASAPPARAGSLPVWVAGSDGAVSRVRVRVRDRAGLPAAWRNGVVLEVGRDSDGPAGAATVSVDYKPFASAFGGGWADRLRLSALPACALTTPAATGCEAKPLPSRNDPALRRVSAEVTVPATGTSLFAVTAGPSSGSGDFTASTLQASSTWSAGGNSGTFSWNYPLRTPPSLGGPAPKVTLAYSSAAVDGRSRATNNQPSWIGEGFDWWPGFIERRYKPCSEDGTSTGDECWGTDNATMSLNGSGGELVRDQATGAWRLKGDDASRIERLTDTVNGDNDNEYWRVTTADGTRYFFGLNRLPGYTGTAPANKTTGSTWTVPVSGNNAGEPCHAGMFVPSFCTQAWRWNLDYVVDTHGNTMSLFYSPETNRYGRNNTASDAVSYVRGGWLDHIDYGTDNRSGTDTENTTTSAPTRIGFDTGDRCVSSCGTAADPTTANWPDTPWDQRCTAAPCTGLYSPTFWTTKRLTTVTTKVWNPAAAGYKNVDAWTLTHNFPDPGDGTRAGMWLESIVHTGKATGGAVIGGDVALPEVNFDWVQLSNRVDAVGDGEFPMNWMRMSTIWNDTGGKIDVAYSGADCVPGSRMPASPQTNTLRCYPVLSEKPDGSLKTEYFNKYVVTSVTESDRTGGGQNVVTSYEYVGTPAWRHTDDDGITKDKRRTWSDYRGYARVNTRVGDAGSQTLSATSYFRGMNGDLNGAGGHRAVTLSAVDGNGDGDTTDVADAPAVADEDAFSGMVRQSTVYNGVETDPVSTTIDEPWQSAPTASRDMGQTTVYARFTGTGASWTATRLAAGGWRVSRADTTFDSYGMAAQTDDTGDVAVADDEQCTKTTYTRNPSINLLSLTGRVERYALRCANPPGTEADVLGDSRTSFDGQVYGSAPSKGDATRVEVAKAWTAGDGPVWLTTSTTSYDGYGRVVDAADVRGNHTTTTYTPTSGGPVTAVAVSTPLGTTSSTVEPSWGTPTAVVDVNNKRSEATFDALGRTRQAWLANRPRASFGTAPSASYTYDVRNSGGVNVITAALLNAASSGTNAHYTTSYTLYDGLLRPRQTQSVSMAAGNVGTVFTETRYDDKGRTASRSQHFDSAVQPSGTLFTIADWQPKARTVSVYDRAGRPTASVFMSDGVEKWRTTYTDGGDRTSVVPPSGGTATTTLTDVHGRIVQLRQYHNPSDVGSDTRSRYDLVSYHYDRKGQQDSITDNAGNRWTYGYDLLGRRTSSHDPDKGDSTASYADTGDLLTATDARGQTTTFGYDNLGRRTGEFNGTVKLATWVFDPPGFKGQLSSSSRWLNNGTEEYRIKIRSYNQLYQPTGEDYTIPSVPSTIGLSGVYSTARTYRYDGSPDSVSYPVAGGLGAETVNYTYDTTTGLPEQLQTNSSELYYVSNTDYNAYGELALAEYKTGVHSFLQRAFSYDDATRRLKEVMTIRQLAPQAVDDTTYDYDPAGNITKVASTSSTGVVDTQCFAQDYAQRLVDAWTPTSADCAATRSSSALGGPAPYWQSWAFDPVGNRSSQTSHATTGDTTTSYSYPAAGSAQPHALASTVAGGVAQSYRYDQSGNTTCRPASASPNTCPAGTGNQTLTWDVEGHLAATTDPSGTSSYVYTAEGARLIADDPSTTTLYLPGMEVKRTRSSGTVVANRYYTWAGQLCAMKTTGGAITWLIGDHQGTQRLAVNAGTQAVTTRYQLPYGGIRGTAVSWPNAKGFVGGDNDATGLTHLGAREYDPGTGRFVSGDPVFEASDPQSLSGFGYSGGSPVSSSDPSGLMREDPSGGGGSAPSSGPCDSVHPYGQSSCEANQGSGGRRRTHASNTTQGRRVCYQATLNEQSCYSVTPEQERQACYELAQARHSCNYDTSPVVQAAQAQAQLDFENAQRHAGVEAAVMVATAAQAAEDQKCSWYNLGNCLAESWHGNVDHFKSFVNDENKWQQTKILFGFASLIPVVGVVFGALAAVMSAYDFYRHARSGDWGSALFDGIDVLLFGWASAAKVAVVKAEGDVAASEATRNLSSPRKIKAADKAARAANRRLAEAEAYEWFMDGPVNITALIVATAIAVAQWVDRTF
jgi:RHS repeat-associated protein